MIQNIINAHFLKKVFFLSILFILVNIIWYVLMLSARNDEPVRIVAPELIFNKIQNVYMKTIYDAEYHKIQPNQIVRIGTHIKTGPYSFAEINLEGNILRLDQNTELALVENNFLPSTSASQNISKPRLVLDLFQGNVWVNAFDAIEIRTPRSIATFEHAVSSFSYTSPLNRIMTITGSVDLALRGKDDSILTKYVIPFHNQATYVDTQIIPDYARLQPSKLKKELKLGSIPDSILEDEWVKRNMANDNQHFFTKDLHLFSRSIYQLKERYYILRRTLALTPSVKQDVILAQSDTKLDYILGRVQEKEKTQEAKRILKEFDALADKIEDDMRLKNMLMHQFYTIGNVDYDSPAFLVKDNLRRRLISENNSKILRTYLSDLEYTLRKNKKDSLDNAQKIAELWLSQWQVNLIKKQQDEFDNQSRIFHSILFAYAEYITPELLALLDKSSDLRLANTDNNSETLYIVTEECLMMTDALIDAYRTNEANRYLESSFNRLKIDELDVDLPARKIFLSQAYLLIQKIKFIEEKEIIARESPNSHGSAPVDDEEFKNFRKREKRDKKIIEELIDFWEEAMEESELIPPPPEEIVQIFAQANIQVSSEDITLLKDFSFQINNAFLKERSSDGVFITFDAVYDFSVDAVQNMIINDTAYRGSYKLDDLVMILTGQNDQPEDDGKGIFDDGKINLGDNDDKYSDIFAQDLAKQLTIKELSHFNINIIGVDRINILDLISLNKFKINDAKISSINNPNTYFSVDLEYNRATKKISKAVLLDYNNEKILTEIDAQQMPQATQKAADLANEKEALSRIIRGEFREKKLSIGLDDIIFDPPDSLEYFRFSNMCLEAVNILCISGTYDRTKEIFTKANHTLFTANDISIEHYFNQLIKYFVVDYLGQKNIIVTQDNIVAHFPFQYIKIKNFAFGDKFLDFKLDIPNNQFKNVSLQGVEGEVSFMTYEDFLKLIGKKNTKETEESVSPSNTEESFDITEDSPEDITEDSPEDITEESSEETEEDISKTEEVEGEILEEESPEIELTTD